MLIRLASLVLAIFVVSGLLPPGEALADSADFEIRFPQEIEVTTFSNTWHASRSGGRRHKGTDLMAPKHSEVYAAADGVVLRVVTSRNAGRYVAIAHAGGWETYYMHLNNDTPGTNNGRAPWFITVADGIYEGAEVKAGQLLGWVGDSGNAEGGSSHTHFEIHRNGRAINPYPYLTAAVELALHPLPLSVVAPVYIR